MKYRYTHKFSNITEELHYSGDVYIETEQNYIDEEYAFEVQCWAENSKVGDVYDDENIHIEVCE